MTKIIALFFMFLSVVFTAGGLFEVLVAKNIMQQIAGLLSMLVGMEAYFVARRIENS